MITKQDIAEIEKFIESIRHPGLKLVCMDCGVQLPGSDPAGTKLSHGLCREHHKQRMAEVLAMPANGRTA